MAALLTRREQWGLIGLVALIAAGLGAAAWLRHGQDEARLVYVPGQGRWEKLADFAAGADGATATSATVAGKMGGMDGAPAAADATRTAAEMMTPAGSAGLDINRATAEELERLPGIGPAKARAIMETRTRAGGFSAIEQLDTVPGIGAATLERLRPFISIAPPDGVAMMVGQVQPAAQEKQEPAVAVTPLVTPAVTPAATPKPALASATPAPTKAAPTPGALIDINRAATAELEQLPGVGPVLARRIVEDRTARGPFGSPRELERVQGIGPKNLAKMLPQIVVGPVN